MRKNLLVTFVVCAVIAVAAGTSPASAEEDWRSMKTEAKRLKVDETAQAALDQLFTSNAKAKELYEGAYGWAVFDNLKLAFGFSGGGGSGVAKEIASGRKTYMRMGTVGVGFGLGANKYQVVFLFQDAQTFDAFVNKGWQADAGATAAAGEESLELKAGFVNGLAIYQLTEKGLMANVDIAGTKYWKDDKLN